MQNQTPPALNSAEEVRKTHLNHEASVQSIGLLYFIGAAIMPIVAIAPLFGSEAVTMQRGLLAALFLVLAAVYFQVGRWLRALNPKARVPTTILSAIGLLGFPIGTLINSYILYLLHSKKGSVVFSSEYRQVIDETPHIRYKTSVITWIFAALVILVLIMLLVAAFASRP